MAKKFFPGHHVLMKPDVTPTLTGGDSKPWVVLNGADGEFLRGGKQYVTWHTLEPTSPGVYVWDHIDALLDALPLGKKMIIGMATQSWNETLVPIPCPSYMVGNPTYDGGYRLDVDAPGATIHVAATMDRWLEMVQAFANRYDNDERLSVVTTMEIPYKDGWRAGTLWSTAALRAQYLKMAQYFPTFFRRTIATSTGMYWTPGDTISLDQYTNYFLSQGGGCGAPDCLAEIHPRYNSAMRPALLANRGKWPVCMGIEYSDTWVSAANATSNAYGSLPWPQAQLDAATLAGANFMYWHTVNRSNDKPRQPNGEGGYDFDNDFLPLIRANKYIGLSLDVPENIRSPATDKGNISGVGGTVLGNVGAIDGTPIANIIAL